MGRIKKVNNADLTAKPKPWLNPPYQPGQSGNPNGRPVGARSKITEKFLLELQNYFEKEGPGLLERAGQESPAALVAVYAKLLPKEAHIEISGGVSVDLTAEQRLRIAEAWMLGRQSDRLDAIEGEAVRVAALPENLPDADEPDDLDEPPDREPEPVAKRSGNTGVHRQTKRPVHSRLIGSRGGND
jgi:hypothetical protein